MVGRCELDSSGSGEGAVAKSCKHGNEPSGYIKARQYLDSDYSEAERSTDLPPPVDLFYLTTVFN
jgi:hypothetical protein